MSNVSVNSYLAFGGRAEEAIEFYKQALQAEVLMLMRFKDSPEPMPGVPDGYDEKVMHATLKIGDSLVMLSDGCGEGLEFAGFSLTLSVNEADEAERLFSELSEGGEVKMPLAKTFWSPKFGMVTDKFGVDWMVDLQVPEVH